MSYPVECNMCGGHFDSQVWEHEHVAECVKLNAAEPLSGESFDSWAKRSEDLRKAKNK